MRGSSIAEGHCAVVEKLTRITIAQGYDWSDFHICDAIRVYIHELSTRTIEFLLDVSSEPSCTGSTLLLSLAAKGAENSYRSFTAAVKVLISKGTDMNTKSDSGYGAVSTLMDWLRREADSHPGQLLEVGSMLHTSRLLAFLIESGCDPNAGMSASDSRSMSDFAAGEQIANSIWTIAVTLAGYTIEPRESRHDKPTSSVVTKIYPPPSSADIESKILACLRQIFVSADHRFSLGYIEKQMVEQLIRPMSSGWRDYDHFAIEDRIRRTQWVSNTKDRRENMLDLLETRRYSSRGLSSPS